MPDPILNSSVTSLYPGYKMVQQPPKATQSIVPHCQPRNTLKGTKPHKLVQPTLIPRGVHMLENRSLRRNLEPGTLSLRSGLLNSEVTLSARWAHCLWVILLPPFHYTAGLPGQTPQDKHQAVAPPASSHALSHSLVT